MNVLIVDDNEASADLLQELLVMQEHSACCTYTARQALDAAAGQRFDAALVDLSLPDMPGTEVARQLRANQKPPVLIAISGYAATDAPAAQGERLFDHHLQKPIDFEALDRILLDLSR